MVNRFNACYTQKYIQHYAIKVDSSNYPDKKIDKLEINQEAEGIERTCIYKGI